MNRVSLSSLYSDITSCNVGVTKVEMSRWVLRKGDTLLVLVAELIQGTEMYVQVPVHVPVHAPPGTPGGPTNRVK
jgi:hypothetical protein